MQTDMRDSRESRFRFQNLPYLFLYLLSLKVLFDRVKKHKADKANGARVHQVGSQQPTVTRVVL